MRLMKKIRLVLKKLSNKDLNKFSTGINKEDNPNASFFTPIERQDVTGLQPTIERQDVTGQ